MLITDIHRGWYEYLKIRISKFKRNLAQDNNKCDCYNGDGGDGDGGFKIKHWKPLFNIILCVKHLDIRIKCQKDPDIHIISDEYP